jgi:C6 transcription factor Pro1
MMTNRKSSNGCWTCRIRRKKCDGTIPICRVCKALEIRCYSDRVRPEWMDNSSKQQEMARNVKAEVKQKANLRRNRRKIATITRNLDQATLNSLAETDHIDHTIRSTASSEQSGQTTSFPNRRPSTSVNGLRSVDVDGIRPGFSPLPIANISPERTDNSPTGQGSPHQRPIVSKTPDLAFVMAYLDYVFPIWFPFYRPTILEGGRSWLLTSILENECICQSVIGLASYFFTIVKIPGTVTESCASCSWQPLQTGTELALKAARQALDGLNHHGVQSDILETAGLVGSVVYLLSVEVILGLNENWQMHLDAANLLFQQLLNSHDQNDRSSTFSIILDMIGNKSFKPPPNSRFWSLAQASFRFHVAMLIFDDIIASTSLERPANLLDYYPSLLVDRPCPELGSGLEPALQLADVFGCQNWALVSIGHIAALDAWKKSRKQVNQLSMAELVHRGATIDQVLRDGLASLEASEPQHGHGFSTEFDMLGFHLPREPDTVKIITRIWALSACSYLFITISGWQLDHPDLRKNVARTITLLTELSMSPTWIRTLSWPLCVAGCLAKIEERMVVR